MERMWKEAVVCPDMSLEGLRRTMNILRIVGIQPRFEPGTSRMQVRSLATLLVLNTRM
jgi:hypothetical protein